MVDVLRAAVAEVEEYSRVNVLPVGQVTLAGRAVGDVTHLLAELIENAVSFSPSYTVVQVGGHLAASGYAIEIEDRGLGMSEESLETANAQIADSPEFNMSSTARLGLYVVSRLANRYGIRVSLKHSAYGGTTAIVLIPRDLVIEDGEVDGDAEMTPDAVSEAPRAVPVGATAGHGGGNAWPAGRAGARTTSGGPPAPPAASEPAARAGGPEKRTGPRPASLDHEGSAGDTGLPIRRSKAPGAPEARDDRPSPEATHTPSGLPFRVPQASLAPELRKDEPSSPPAEPADDDVRSPEDIRRVMGAYQAGTRRGRSDAAQTVGEGGAPASDAEDDPQRHLPNNP
jgi:anti-sigma regulatory factor (Ser/Thr protein kinase)